MDVRTSWREQVAPAGVALFCRFDDCDGVVNSAALGTASADASLDGENRRHRIQRPVRLYPAHAACFPGLDQPGKPRQNQTDGGIKQIKSDRLFQRPAFGEIKKILEHGEAPLWQKKQ